MDLPPEERPETIDIGSIRGISIIADDDPRVAEDRAAWSAARRIAQALQTPDDLLRGLRHHDWRIRHESVDRLIARVRSDARTLPALLEAAIHDSSVEVRDAVVMRLTDFDQAAVVPVLQRAVHDRDRGVRWAAQYALFQKGLGSDPGLFDCVEGGDGWCEIIDGPRAVEGA